MPRTETYHQMTTGHCDNCGRYRVVDQEIEQEFDDNNYLEDSTVIRSICKDCAQQ